MNARRAVGACALSLGLGVLSLSPAAAQDAGASTDDTRSRILFAQQLAFMRARGAALVPTLPEAYKPPVAFPVARTGFERTPNAAIRTVPATSEELFEAAIATTYRMLLAQGITCCLCSTATTCSDSLYCNGAETCASGVCATGAAPCVDGNPCTTDTCNENLDTCSFPPVPPPPEVTRLDLSHGAPPSTVATLAWSAVTGASSYNVYRGTLANLGDLACFQSGVTGLTQADDGVRPIGGFYYLVTSKACGESGLGNGNPSPRPPAPGCP